MAIIGTSPVNLPKNRDPSSHSSSFTDYLDAQAAEEVHAFCFPKRNDTATGLSPSAFGRMGMDGDLASSVRNSYTAVHMAQTGAGDSPAVTHPLGFPTMALGVYLGGELVRRGYNTYKTAVKTNDVAGKYFGGCGIVSSGAFLTGAAAFVPSRVINTVNIFKPVSMTAMSAAGTLASIGGIAFGVFYVVDLVANSYKMDHINRFREEMSAFMKNAQGLDGDKAIAYLEFLKKKMETPAGKAELTRLLGGELAKEIEQAAAHTQAKELIAQAREHVETQRNRTIIGIIIDILGIATTILTLPWGIPFWAGVAGTALMAFTAVVWMLLDIIPMIEGASAAKGRHDKGFIIATTIVYILTTALSMFVGIRDKDTVAIIVSAVLGALWVLTSAGALHNYKKSRRIDVIAEMIEKLRKRHFEAVKELLKVYQTQEARTRIVAYVKKSLDDYALHDYLDQLSNETPLTAQIL